MNAYGGETVGECSRCKKLYGDEWAVGAAGYKRRWTELADLCDECMKDLQRWLDDGGK